MTTLRWSRAKASSTTPKLRWAKALAQGAGATPTLRWAAASATGAGPVSLQPIPDQTVDSLTTVTLVAAYVGTTAPDSYQWRQVSGPSVAFLDNGTSVTFTAPPSMTGTPVVFGVSAVKGGAVSAEVIATVNLIPHLDWTATSTGWVALTRTATA